MGWKLQKGALKKAYFPFTIGEYVEKTLLQVYEEISFLIIHCLDQLKTNLLNKKYTISVS